MLVGDGFERPKIETLVKQLALEQVVFFTGKKPFAEIPRVISIFDIAIVSASSSVDFHYSPLKLREYLAAGKPTLAPRAGQISTAFEDGKQLMMYKVGDIDDMAEKIAGVIGDKELRTRLQVGAMEYIDNNGTWDIELARVWKKLNQ